MDEKIFFFLSFIPLCCYILFIRCDTSDKIVREEWVINFIGEWYHESDVIAGPDYKKRVYNFYEDSTYKYRYYVVKLDSLVDSDTGTFSVNVTWDTITVISDSTGSKCKYEFKNEARQFEIYCYFTDSLGTTLRYLLQQSVK